MYAASNLNFLTRSLSLILFVQRIQQNGRV